MRTWLRLENTHNELLVANGHREVAVKRDPEVVGVVPLVGNDMLQ